jgi:hypothetical protein
MARVVVAGSENDTHVAVIDFTVPAAPSVAHIDPGFGSGTRVAIDGTSAAAGAVLTGNVRLIDVSNPAVPVAQGTFNTMLQGIGAIAVRGAHVAIGEYVNDFQARVKLLDFSNPMAPTLVGTAATVLTNITVPHPDDPADTSAAIASLAFLDDFNVVVSGPSDPVAIKINFGVTPPGQTTLNPMIPGGLTTDADAGAHRIAIGDNNGTQVKLFDASTNALLGTANTTLGGVGSLALNMPRAFAGSPNDSIVARVDFSGASPVVTTFDGALAGGVTVAIEGTRGAGGAILGTNVKLYDLSVNPPVVLGTADSGLASISTLAMSTPPPGPMFLAMPMSLNFQAVRVGMTRILPVAISNPGGMPLVLNGIHSTDSHFTFAPPAAMQTIPPGGMPLTLNVTFAPLAEMPYGGAIALTTNDPAHLTVSIALMGMGALPHISGVPMSLNVGSAVPICLTGMAPLPIHNSGAVDLHVSAATNPPFSVAPMTLTVPMMSTVNLTVHFTPPGLGPSAGTLTLTTDDPGNPVVPVQLTATAVAAPPAIVPPPPALVFGDVPVQFFIGLRLPIMNSSPCEALNVTLTSSGDPFFVTGVDPTTVPPSSLSVTDTVAPSSTKRYVVVFAPTMTGVAPAGTLTITTNDPMHPTIAVALSGTGVQLAPAAMELVLDRSGSMAAPAQSGTKIDGLHTAVHLFSDLVLTGRGDEMGSVEFDDMIHELTPFGAFDDAKRTAIQHDADGLTPRGLTSIGGGIELAQMLMSGTALSRKIMLVFTDGMENTPPSIAMAKSMLPADFEIYAVALGRPENISTSALHDLAASSNGRFFITDDTLILRKNFVQVLADAFRMNMAADPLLDLAPGATVDVPVQITTCEYRISFVVDWDNAASDVSLTVLAPDGTPFTAASPATNRLVQFGARPGYRFLRIAFPPLDPGSGSAVIGPAQIGTWIMRLEASHLAGPSERCTTSVVVESDLKIRSIVAPTSVGAPINVLTQIAHGADTVSGADVRLMLTAPIDSLAAVSTPAVVNAALNADHMPIPTGEKPRIRTTTERFQLIFDKRRQGYTAQLPVPQVDGVYTFEVQARGKACSGEFERYETFSVYVGRKADGGRSKVTVCRFNANVVNVVLDLRDAKGHPLGPGQAGQIRATMKGGTVWPAIDRHDGTYVIRATWPPRIRKPSLRIEACGATWTVPVGKG